jgi:hypothetical protein
MVMPALPGAHLVRIHAYLTFASFETRFNADARLDHARQLRQRRLLRLRRVSLSRCEVILVAIARVLRRPREACASNVSASTSGRRVTTSHSSGPVRLRSSRVCTRRVTISISTGPFSPSRTVNRVHLSGGSACRQVVTDWAFGRRPHPRYAGYGASRSRIAVWQGTPNISSTGKI